MSVDVKQDQEFIIERVYDPISLHTLASLGFTNITPNLDTGEIESISFIEFAHLIDPPISCPNCSTPSIEGSDSMLFTPSLVIKSASGQCSYLCVSCWGHTKIPSFGIHSQGADDS